MRDEQIIGYVFNADLYHERCIAGALAQHGWPVAPGEVDHADAAEAMLDEFAEQRGIDRSDERTFDSGAFPKVYMAGHYEDHEDGSPRVCGLCLEPMLEG